MSAGSERRAAAAPRAVPAPRASRVELRLSCRHLLDRDPLTKSDPSVLLLLRSQNQWVQVDRTEVVRSSLHPVFSKVFTLDYYFEEVQKLRFEVYDTRGPSDLGYQDDDFLGGMECTLGQIVAQKKVTRALLLRFGRNAGKSTITVTAEDISGNNGYVELSFRARKLDDKDLFSKSDPFLELYRVNDDGSEQLVYRTEVVKDNLSPVWEPFKVSLNTLCSCEETRPLKCLVWDHDSRGKHDFIGEFSTTFEEMQKAFGEDQAQWDCVNAKYRQKKRNYKNSGVVILADLKGSLFPGLHHGRLSDSLHRECTGPSTPAEPGRPAHPGCNSEPGPGPGADVQKWPSISQPPTVTRGTAALCTISTLSSPMSTCRPWWPWERSARTMTVTRDFLLWGLEHGSLPSMRCPMTLPSTSTLRTMSVKGSRAWWRPIGTACPGSSSTAPPTWPLSSPRWPAWQRPRRALGRPPHRAPRSHSLQPLVRLPLSVLQYYILLVLTDGVVTDMADAREAIVRASHLPMSIIIVGVGNADFTDMQTLDGDEGILRSPRGEPALRDIVQFVPFRELKSASPAALAKCVLAEVPRQVVEYFSYRELPPRGLGTHTHDAGPERAGQPGVRPVSVSSTLGVP
ncbi:copine-7 isoform X2 [Prionailurus viverrinus]|uniref:copine-7 isoform X2 n=1 Tax=Prionailurus viverrinus TaxID=61388 RepID=UPI001FF11F6C|nr:copine-7 isoform X2 [Prionailurus viverrinus]